MTPSFLSITRIVTRRMSNVLGYVPVLASAALGLLYLALGEGSPRLKGVGVMVFLVAAYLQFVAGDLLPGILLQIALAFTLEMWRRANT